MVLKIKNFFLTIFLLLFVGMTIEPIHHSLEDWASSFLQVASDSQESKLHSSADSDHGDEPADCNNSEHCDCPLHHSGCHHNLAHLKWASDIQFGLLISKLRFVNLLSAFKAAPFLEGPYQPPRA